MANVYNPQRFAQINISELAKTNPVAVTQYEKLIHNMAKCSLCHKSSYPAVQHRDGFEYHAKYVSAPIAVTVFDNMLFNTAASLIGNNPDYTFDAAHVQVLYLPLGLVRQTGSHFAGTYKPVSRHTIDQYCRNAARSWDEQVFTMTEFINMRRRSNSRSNYATS